MAHRHPSNVAESATNTPASEATAFALAGTADAPMRTFAAALNNGDTCPVHASNGTDWQDFVGTYNAGTLAQTTLLDSSTGAWVDWSAGGEVALEIAWLGATGEETEAHTVDATKHLPASPMLGQMVVQSSTGPIWVDYADALTNTVAPVVSGSTGYDNELSCTTGTWSGFGAISYAYQWYADAVILSGETTNTYTTAFSDVGAEITCIVTATDTLTSASANSNGITVTGSPLHTSEFYAPLTHSLILTRGTGDPTYTRATTAWGFDNEGVLQEVPAGVARFGGARLSPVCAWYDAAGTTNYPKGNNNNALKDANDATVVYQSDGYSSCGKTGSATNFAKTTHNGQNCGVADLNGNMWEVSPGITCVSGTKSITGITLSNPVDLLIVGHGRATGDIVMVTGIVGTTQLNDKLYTCTVVDADHITLDGVDGSGMTAYTSGGTLTYGTVYALNTSYAAKDLTGGNTLATDQWGATGVAAHSTAIVPTFRTDYPQNGFEKRYGKSTNQVLSAATSGDGWTLTGLGVPLSTGISDGTSGSNLFGADYFYQYICNELCLLSGASWSNSSRAGVWAAHWGNAQTSSSNFVGFRAASYLPSFTSVTGDENVRHSGGVGVCPELPAGFTGVTGYNVLGSDNYGNYTYSDGSVMVWISVHYYKYDADNTVDIRPYSFFADLATAQASGYTIHRMFYDGGALQPGFFADKYTCSNNSGTASSLKYGSPLSTHTIVHNPISALTGSPAANYGGCFAAAKTRGAQFFPMMRYQFAGLALLALWQGQYAATLANTTGNKGYQWSTTDNAGSAISTSTLLGYHAEGARTNNLLYSRDLTNAAWAKTNVTAAKTATGIDNAANSASTLTAGAADATILQTLTLAAAARSFSAYVKRRTGTGNIYITRDGGTSWTDVTVDINDTAWTRVKIENSSVLNPSVGFKFATSGDEIDVDVCQDEAGAFASSPIITTTAVVTRDADSLTYATASNWSDVAGAARAEVYYDTWANASGRAIGDTNGLGLSASNSGVQALDGTNTVNGPAGTPSGAELLAIGWGSGALKAASGGVLGAAGGYDGGFGLSSIALGAAGGYIKAAHIWQSALSNADLQVVTTP